MFLLNLPIPPNLPPYNAKTGQSLFPTGRVDNNEHQGPRIITEEDGTPDDVSMTEMLGGKRQPSDDIIVVIKDKKKSKPKK